jgi:hypothetical protein
MEKLLIGIVAVNSRYINFAKKMIKKINNQIKTNFLILTDNMAEFSEFDNVTLIKYDKPIFSYHDKIAIFKEGFKLYDTVLLLDADTTIREGTDFINIDVNEIVPGIYPQIIWRHPADCSMENFLLGKTCRVPYGLLYKEFCLEHNLLFDNALLIQESFLLIKRNDKIDKFFATWDLLADFCNKKDSENCQSILGYGEGYSIGISALNADLDIIENDKNINKLISCFKHYAWEQWDISEL